MPDYRIQGVPEDVWRLFKATCAVEGVTPNKKLIDMIREHVDAHKWPKSGKRSS